jgi:site-specific DNA recombinase
MRAAIYARYSSDLQRPTSIEDQIRQCQRAIDLRGWAVLSDYIRSDSGVSGATLHAREGLNSLINDANKRPRPFDVIVVDDTSRLGRNLTDVLTISDRLKYDDVFLFFVSQQLDSRDSGFRQLLIMNGMMDEQFLVGLSARSHRGQEGRVLKGLLHGGRCYGYRNVPVDDYSRGGDFSRRAILGVRQEVLEAEANVIRRMFALRSEGRSLAAIAHMFNAEKIPAPRPHRGGLRAWSPNAIHSMIRNEKYHGRIIWNRTRKIRNPGNGKRQQKARPKDEWVIVEAPELRIVSEEVWQKVQDHNKRMQEKFGIARLGGLDRKDNRKDYLFSGLLICAVCGQRIVIVGGTGKTASYGCPAYRYKRVCPNKLTIRHDRLERQVIKFLTEVVLRPDNLEYAISEFHHQIQCEAANYIGARKKAQDERPKLSIELRRLENEARHLADAIARYGTDRSPALLSELSLRENRIETINTLLEESMPELPDVPIERIREFVLQQSTNLESVLMGDRHAAKQALRAHFKPLVLAPKETIDGPIFMVQGTLDLFSGLADVMLLASPTGFEPVLSP